MPIKDILIRSLTGYIFVFPGILFYFLYLKKSDKKQTFLHILTAFIFSYYLIGIMTMTGIHEIKSFSPRMALIPFLEMINGPVDTILNVILFLPLGFFLPLIYKEYNNIIRIISTGFFLSLSVELIQMFDMGATDVNDLITNTIGACIGYYIYKLFSKLTGKNFCEKFQAIKIHAFNEALFFIVYSYVIMLTVQPLIIHSLFNLG